MEWYHVCWPRLTAKRVEPVVSISWASCWTTYTNFDNCCLRYIATRWKILYGCTTTFSALNYWGGIFVKSLSYLYEVVRTNFSAYFSTFRNFWRQFGENCGASWRQKLEPCSASEREKRWKPRQNRPITGNAMLVRNMHPRTHGAPDLERDIKTNKQTKINPHIFAPTAGTHCTIFPKLCMIIELVMPIKKVWSIFWSNA